MSSFAQQILIMANYTRPQLKILSGRLAERRKFIQVVLGPRQVGKTMMVQQLLKQLKLPHLFAAADATPATAGHWIAQQWETARLKCRQVGAKEFLLVFDEIQKIDNWSEEVKAQWDADTRNKTPIKVVLLGSSRLLLQQGLSESLAGRFENLYMPHWSFIEMRKAFGWNEEQYAWFGGYPGAAALVNDETRWKDYVNHSLIETSISRDILMLTRVDKPALMKRLFELGCDYSGQVLSFTKMLGQLVDAGNTTTLSYYLQLLNTAGLLAGLEKFNTGKIRQRASSPKFQVHNNALMSTQRPDAFKEVQQQRHEWGRVVESAVGAHLLNHSITDNFQLSYWREGQHEIDFVISSGKRVVGIEVKSGKSQKISGAAAFRKEYPNAKLIVIENNGLSWKELLRMNPEELL